MASLGGNMLPLDNSLTNMFAGIAVAVASSLCFSKLFGYSSSSSDGASPGLLKSFLLFFYSCFIKPHNGDEKGTQQDALESFYKKQAGAYDATRKILLQGREDMLALSAAQLKAKARALAEAKGRENQKRIWVDVRNFPGVFSRVCLHINVFPDLGGWWHWLEYRGHVSLRQRPRVFLQRLPRRLFPFPLRGRPKALRETRLDQRQGDLRRCEEVSPRGS